MSLSVDAHFLSAVTHCCGWQGLLCDFITSDCIYPLFSSDPCNVYGLSSDFSLSLSAGVPVPKKPASSQE